MTVSASHTAAETAVSPSVRVRTRRALLRWYDRHKRDLPWRKRQRDPYAQWVAEIMLQQTRVDTVLSYYERFLDRFPTVTALARAHHDAVLKLWEGLGYYRRVLHLHRAAIELDEADRPVPTTAADLRTLPGIGEYTAAAIASIAYGERVAAVDGNVARVIARLFGVTDDILSTRGKARITAIAHELIPPGRPGDFNQAWMDLGSSICTPTSPDCPRCPLCKDCNAVATGRSESLPRRGIERDRTPRAQSLVVGVFARNGRLLMRRRPPGGLWSNLWELPGVVVAGTKGHARAVRLLANDCGLDGASDVTKVGTVRHKLTHRSLTFHVYRSEVQRGMRLREKDTARCWVTASERTNLSISTAHRRILDTVAASKRK